ncbi:MAG: esterase, partial [Betaproteobacteria bacterium]|nr:esterase [Betaproteobacteria bacterium]
KVDPERYLLLLETGDEVLDWCQAARKYEGARMVVRDGGDHSLQSFPEQIPRILAFAGLG